MAAQALWVGIALPACHGMADFLDHLRCCWLTLECLVRGGEPTLDALLGGAEHGYIFLGMTQWHKCGFPTLQSFKEHIGHACEAILAAAHILCHWVTVICCDQSGFPCSDDYSDA